MNERHESTISDAFVSFANRLKLLDLYSFLKSNIKSYVAIICYHRVGDTKDRWAIDTTDIVDFEKEMRYLTKTHKILSLEEIAGIINGNKALPKRGVVVTFDDGYKDNYTNAFPVLKKYNIPATIFLTTGNIGTGHLFWWDKLEYILCNTKIKSFDLGDFGTIITPSGKNKIKKLDKITIRFTKMPEDKKNNLIENLVKNSDVDFPKNLGKDIIMSWDEIKQMSEGGINFGAHTVTHPILTKIPLNQAKNEIINSKKEIEKRLKKPVTTFSYPNGLADDYNEDIKTILKENGFICATTIIPKIVNKNSDLFELGRLPPGKDFNSFKFCLSGLYSG
jgi:peptidoglycan/xylan/chitin deacetylase (PgdA/CDA1 family)